jgi:hypothetical protein
VFLLVALLPSSKFSGKYAPFLPPLLNCVHVQKFDLKGSVRNRLVNTAGKQSEEELVLLDENLLKCE